MINQWKQYLQQTGAYFDDTGKVAHFGRPQPEKMINENVLVDLSHLQMIQVSGNDALPFLQGQFTNDVRQINSEQSQLNAWCNPKGRIITNFRLFKRQDVYYYMVLPQESVTTVVERLRKYILRADVKIEITHDLLCIGIAGEQSTQVLTECLGYSLPNMTTHAVLTEASTTIIKVSESQQRYMIIGEMVTIKKLWECATATLQPVGTSAWQLLDILSGIPQIVSATTEEFVPQMINLQILGGVSFKKGCYPGQEVVARMQYLATQKRQMYLLKATNATTVPSPGDLLYADSEDESSNFGKIVNAEPMPEGGYIALAVLPIDLNVKEIRDAQGIILQPFAIT